MNLANWISISRIILTPVFIAAVVYSRFDFALIFFSVAIISDGLDGFIARTLKQKTRLGTILDPVADKLLLISAYVCLSMVSNIPESLRLPAYVPIIVISRDAIIVLGSIIVYIIKGNIKIAPSILGKITTFCQMVTILSILLGFKYSVYVWNITVFMTIVSGADYVLRGAKLLNDNNHVRGAAQ